MMAGIVARYSEWLDDRRKQVGLDAGLLLLRVSAGAMMAFGHGWSKLATYTERAATFPDPLGVSSPVSLALVVFAEFFCAMLVALGAATRFAAIPIVINMLVAAFVIHGDDPWRRQEFAILFLIFDVEAVFLFPWAVVFLDSIKAVFYEMIIFIGILAFGILYGWRKGVLHWR